MLGVFCTMASGKVSAAAKSLSRVRLLATPWTATHQAPPPMGFSRQEYWSGVPLPSAGKVSKKVKFKLQYLRTRKPALGGSQARASWEWVRGKKYERIDG